MGLINSTRLFPNLSDIVSRRFLGVDYGRVRVGFSLGQLITRTATPVAIVFSKKGIFNWSSFDWIMKCWFPDDIIIGLAKDFNNKETCVAQLCRSFAIQVKKRYRTPVYLVDELLSSYDSHLKVNDLSTEIVSSAFIDDFSACLILETWMNLY